MIHPLTKDVIAVGVPLNSTGIFASYNDIETVLYYDKGEVKLFDYCQHVEYIGLYSQATEEMAKRIVNMKANLYTDYQNEKVVCVTAKASLTTLMNSKGLYLVNPYGEKKPFIEQRGFAEDFSKEEIEYMERKVSEWQEAEDRKSDYVFLINPTPAINI